MTRSRTPRSGRDVFLTSAVAALEWRPERATRHCDRARNISYIFDPGRRSGSGPDQSELKNESAPEPACLKFPVRFGGLLLGKCAGDPKSYLALRGELSQRVELLLGL